MRGGCEKFNFILIKVLHPVQSGRYHRDFSHLISPAWAAVPLPVPGKMLNTLHIIWTMILNKVACLPVGNRFYCIQHSNHVKTIPIYIARAKNKNKSKNCPCRRDYITRELCCITQEIKNPTIDTAILRREYAGCY